MYDDDDAVPSYPRGPSTGITILVALITSVITSAGVFFALRAALPVRTPAQATAPVEVPSVVGTTVSQARELLDGKGLLLTLAEERDDATVAKGAIASQSPLAGSTALPGSEVRAIVSRGKTTIAVPEVVGLAVEAATQKLGAVKLATGAQGAEPHATAPAGVVTATEPPAGTEVAPGTAVKLVVSSGPAAVDVPKVTGMSLGRAKETLATAGFQLGATKYAFDEERDAYIVLRQEPAAGAKAAPGSKVDLVVNSVD